MVDRPKFWGRQHTAIATDSGGRLALGGGFIAAGATLERVIFGWHFYQDVFWGGRRGAPEHTSLVAGVLLTTAAAGAPAVDPVSSPGADWLWVGVLTARVEHLRYATESEYRVVFESPASQVQTESRRKGPAADFGAVWLVTRPLSTLGSQFSRWEGESYISSLYSLPA